MSCLICENPFARTLCTGAGQEFHCPECGQGRVSQELLNVMMLLNLQLDIGRSRRWLKERRRTDPLPIMRVSDILLCRAAHEATGPATRAEG
jgi:hypothetical protein